MLDVRRRGRAGAWVTCGLRAGGGRDGGPSSRFGAVLSRREFRRTIGDGGGRGRAGAWGTFGFCLNFEFCTSPLCYYLSLLFVYPMRLHAGSLRNRCFVCFSARVQGRQARPPRRGAMAGKISAREEKAANKEAEAVLASLSRAGEAAVTQTLDDIREVLKKDAPLMYHINALLHNQEWTAVLKASINGIAAVAASGDKPDCQRRQA